MYGMLNYFISTLEYEILPIKEKFRRLLFGLIIDFDPIDVRSYALIINLTLNDKYESSLLRHRKKFLENFRKFISQEVHIRILTLTLIIKIFFTKIVITNFHLKFRKLSFMFVSYFELLRLQNF